MLKISFNFDETSQLVSNIKVEHVTGTKTRGILTTNAPTNENNFGPDVEVLENKLQLSKAALFKLDAKADDRISIQYVSEGIGKSSPLIGKAAAFTDRNDGNRLTAKGTVSFRGEKRSTLVEFGTAFTMQEFKEGIWKLVPYEISDDNDNLMEEEQDVQNLESSEIDKEIEEITSSMVDDDLPF